jgi:uncharacterized protein YjbI with pentapeptide repeats
LPSHTPSGHSDDASWLYLNTNSRGPQTRLDGADLAGAFLTGAQFLNCAQLTVARNWQSAFRDDALACGASLPDRMRSE